MQTLRISMLALAVAAVCAQDTKYPPEWQQIPGPPSKAETKEWLKDVRRWREEERVRAGLSGETYEDAATAWAASSFMQPQVMVEDRYLYDPVQRRYTVDRLLDNFNARYGGIDSILLWPVYPNIGIDDRNQFDMLRSMPGGLAALKAMVADFHRRGVRVLFPNMPWDTGTRPEPLSKPDTIAKLLNEIGADGVNGDTFAGMPRTYLLAGRGLALEPELYPAGDEMLNWNVMSWGYWKYPFVPMISKAKWLEPRHMVNVCDRWNRDHTDNLQAAFFNGVGFETWENVWSIWNGITGRDAEAIRRVATIERAFPALLTSADWEPHTPTVQYGVFASRFPGRNRVLWTLVNRTEANVGGPQLEIAGEPGVRYFDLWHGVELHPAEANHSAVLSFEMEAHGFGSILAQREAPDAALTELLAKMKARAARPLATYPHTWNFLPQKLVPAEATAPASSTPEGMVAIPAAPEFVFTVSGVEIEGGDSVGVDVQYPWEDSPRRHHSHPVKIEPFYLDKYPVTNKEFRAFLTATRYRPADEGNFLRNWSNGNYPAGQDNKPVTWVSLEDARAYAKWAGKRLPREWEWQYAAQGTDGRPYPWGDGWDAARVPAAQHGRELQPPDDVDAHPAGASPFGVMDMTGNIWQWTDEFEDEHTRTAILRGGGSYRPSGSAWYFPQTFRLDEHGKYLLMAPAKDRSGMVGFRCAKDR